MAVGGNPTRIADVIVPEVFNSYVSHYTTEKSNLVQSGIIVPNPELDALAASGGVMVNMPYWNDLTGDDEVLSDSPGWALTPQKITAGQDRAHLLMRGKAWSSSDLAKALSGDDPQGEIANKVGAYWLRVRQRVLLSVLSGVFASGTMEENKKVSDKPFNAETFIDAKMLFGDSHELLTAIAVNSKVYASMLKQGLIETIRDADNNPFKAFQGLRIILDDNLPYEDGKATSYIFGQGAIGFGQGGAPVPVETDRHSTGGYDVLVNRQHFLLHPRGVRFEAAYVAGSSPTNAELENPGNWKRVYDPRNVRIVQLITQEEPAAGEV